LSCSRLSLLQIFTPIDRKLLVFSRWGAKQKRTAKVGENQNLIIETLISAVEKSS
jgi:hypothetical protein